MATSALTSGFAAPERPQLWRLALHIDDTSLYALARNTMDDTDYASLSLLLPQPGLSAIQDAVYSAPALLADYGRVDVLMRTDTYTAVPGEFGKEARRDVASLMWNIADSDETLMSDAMDGCGAALLWTLDARVANFLARTFRNPRIHHTLALLGDYFARRCRRGNGSKLYLHLHGSSAVDIACFDAGGILQLVTSKRAATDNDVLYYAMSALKACGIDAEAAEVLLCGDMRRRQSVTPVLRRYVPAVLPLIFPSEAYRPEAPAAPFPLTILELCE